MQKRRAIFNAARILLLISFVLVLALPVRADSGEITVRPSDLNGWQFIDEGAAGSTGQLVVGPDAPPLGGGSASFQLSTAEQGMSFQYLGAETVGLALADVTQLGYCTYVEAAPGPQAVSLQFNFDDDVTDGDTSWKGRLVFEPYQQNGSSTVVANEWQCWDALQGEWWATGTPANGTAPQSNPQSIAAILTAFPDAGFNSNFGGLLVKAGSGWSSFDGNADAVEIATADWSKTFNFETEPAAKDDCKKGGWQDYGFPNQGLCIKYFNKNVK